MLLATLLTVLGQHSGDKIQPSLGLAQPHYSRVTEGGQKILDRQLFWNP